jgi:uroporphyrinogen-III synthase
MALQEVLSSEDHRMSTTFTENKPSKGTKIASILITQSQAADSKVYQDLVLRFKVKIDFKPFIEIQAVDAREFRKQKINLAEYTAIVFTSKHAVDHFYRLCTEMKVEINPDWKYFCITEATANYLQKYVQVRKRKVFTGQKTALDLIEIFKKHKIEKFLFPCSNIRTPEIPDYFTKNGFTYKEAIMYCTVPSDLSELKDVHYDIIAFFSPSGVQSLLHNFPDFKQNSTKLAAFGATTSKAIIESGLVTDIEAPQPSLPSMAAALEAYVEKANKGK